ncbi:MAG: aminotransferase class I/II-fold pyridoxal phosphate-dependent enzyme [Chitinophagaceae bacterium]
MTNFNRRKFLKASGLSALPLVVPVLPAIASGHGVYQSPAPERAITFTSDGEFFSTPNYIAKLQEISTAKGIAPDIYGSGGAVAALEKKFTEITGKEKAIFMPSGTMANQFAIHVLSGENTKVFVQETSHVYRDEADAAQSVFNKRLIPVGKGQTGFTADELKEAVDYHKQGEVFASGMGAVSIENPVRRADGRMMPIDELRKIAAYCKQEGLKLHLDGARLYMASAWSGVSIAEYSSLFDTVYISLYKYLGASGGAILCGDKATIDKMPHLMKIHGGTMFGNWTNAAMALHMVEGFDARIQQARKRADELFVLLKNSLDIKATVLQNGTNIHFLQLPKPVKPEVFSATIRQEYNMRVIQPDAKGMMRFMINETILYRDVNAIVDAFRAGMKAAAV